jgi:hypothetical protein
VDVRIVTSPVSFTPVLGAERCADATGQPRTGDRRSIGPNVPPGGTCEPIGAFELDDGG